MCRALERQYRTDGIMTCLRVTVGTIEYGDSSAEPHASVPLVKKRVDTNPFRGAAPLHEQRPGIRAECAEPRSCYASKSDSATKRESLPSCAEVFR